MTEEQGGPRNGRFRISATTLAASASTIGAVGTLVGFILGAYTVRDAVGVLEKGFIGMQDHLNKSDEARFNDREAILNRLTKLESAAEHTKEGIEDLKKLRAGTNR